MPAANKTLSIRKPTARSRVSNGADLLPGIDGRSAAARRYRDIAAAIVADQGGLLQMSEARMQLARRFAAQAVMAEELEARLAMGEPIKTEEHALISSTLVRLASRLGLERRVRKVIPDLGDYLEAQAKALKPEEALPS
jgi:hypothetical protein